MGKTCFNCGQSYTLNGYEGLYCHKKGECDCGSLWEPIKSCDNCTFKDDYNHDGTCLFKLDKQAGKIKLLRGKTFYKASNRYPTNDSSEAESYCCPKINGYWAWKRKE